MELFKIIGNLLTKNVANPLEGVVNTVASLVRDKTHDADTSFIREKVRKGISVSKKRVLNFAVTGASLATALSDMDTNGINGWNLGLAVAGMAFCIIMAWLTNKNEAKKKDTPPY